MKPYTKTNYSWRRKTVSSKEDAHLVARMRYQLILGLVSLCSRIPEKPIAIFPKCKCHRNKIVYNWVMLYQTILIFHVNQFLWFVFITNMNLMSIMISMKYGNFLPLTILAWNVKHNYERNLENTGQPYHLYTFFLNFKFIL